MRNSIWTEECIAKVKAMWESGMVASKIATTIGKNVTRSAILGKLHRLKLTRSGVAAAKQKEPLQLLTLEYNSCRWPNGHPGSKGFHFCGKERSQQYPYCVEHTQKAYSQ